MRIAHCWCCWQWTVINALEWQTTPRHTAQPCRLNIAEVTQVVQVLLLPMVRLLLLGPASQAASCQRVRALGQPLRLLASVRPPTQRGRTLLNE